MYYLKLDNKLDRTVEKEIYYFLYFAVFNNSFSNEETLIDFMKLFNCQESKDIEKILSQDARMYYKYCAKIIKKRSEKAEKIILENLEVAVLYSANIINDRWEELEKKLIQDFKVTKDPTLLIEYSDHVYFYKGYEIKEIREEIINSKNKNTIFKYAETLKLKNDKEVRGIYEENSPYLYLLDAIK